MKIKYLLNGLLLILLGLIVGLIILQQKRLDSHVPEFVQGLTYYDVVQVKKKIAGKLEAVNLVEIKSNRTGTVEEIFVGVGDTVETWSWIARIQPVPEQEEIEQEEIEQARNTIRKAEIEFQLEQNNYARKSGLQSRGGIAPSDMERARSNLELRKLELVAARKQLKMLMEGHFGEDENNVIVATKTGIVTSLPVKIGQHVSKGNSNSVGTTVAEVVGIGKLVFIGLISEYEINELKVGTPIKYSIPAYNNFESHGEVLRIEPKAVNSQSAIRFNFEASIDLPESLSTRTGLTVMATYIAESTDSVVCVDEKYLFYAGDSVLVEALDPEFGWRKKSVVLGISDGTKVQVLEGLQAKEKVKLVDWH